jgi:hypothetical protein
MALGKGQTQVTGRVPRGWGDTFAGCELLDPAALVPAWTAQAGEGGGRGAALLTLVPVPNASSSL